MIKILPILLAVLYGLALYRFSAWRTKRMLDAQSTELADPVLKSQMDALARALDLPHIRVHLYEIPAVNGLATPDGRIFITRGFYNQYRSGAVTSEELTSVIAHELGHVALGHARRRLIDFSGQNALRTALAMVLSRVSLGLGPLIANGLMTLLAARLSRRDEFEADAYASALLIKAGFGTAPQISLFKKLDTLTGAYGASMPAWVMSHPKTERRIAAITENAAKWGES